MSTVKTQPKVTHVDVLKDIEEFYTDNAIDAWCPAIRKTLKFKPLSVKQLKQFIDIQLSAMKDETGVLPQLNMGKRLNGIVIDNVVGVDDIGSTATILDRDAIVVQLRANIKPMAEIQRSQEDEGFEINLNDVINRLKGKKLNSKLQSKCTIFDFSAGQIKLELELPTLARDQHANDHFRTKISPKLKKGKAGVEKELDAILSQLYFLELSKYIKAVTVTRDGTSSVLKFDDHELWKSLDSLETLPSNIIAEISTFITDIKAFRDSVLCYVDDEDKEVPLDVDANIFTGI